VRKWCFHLSGSSLDNLVLQGNVWKVLTRISNFMVEKRIFTLPFRGGFTHKQNVGVSPTVRKYIRNQEEHYSFI